MSGAPETSPGGALSHLRFRVEQSRGRRRPERRHPYRGPYQRDRDRIIHSRAFRRLERKTQVFTSPHSDHFRNRLTHTIEVTQAARTVAAALGLNEDLVEALALAHDIGHPPFGHCGVEALNKEMRRYGRLFDHNLHALRIVETFENRYAGFPGLNLTFEVREGLVKHSSDYTVEQYPELAEYLLDQLPPLEAQLIDPADEIAYNCADLDDAVEAGLLDIALVRRRIEAFDRAAANAERGYPGEHRLRIFNEALRVLMDGLVSGLIEGTCRAAKGYADVDAVRAAPARLACFDEESATTSRLLKELLAEQVYGSAELERESAHAASKLRELFAFFAEHPEHLPRVYRERAENEPLYRLTCDYVAGMTDNYLMRRHEELIGGAR